jgi:hypothetical protein
MGGKPRAAAQEWSLTTQRSIDDENTRVARLFLPLVFHDCTRREKPIANPFHLDQDTPDSRTKQGKQFHRMSIPDNQ